MALYVNKLLKRGCNKGRVVLTGKRVNRRVVHRLEILCKYYLLRREKHINTLVELKISLFEDRNGRLILLGCEIKALNTPRY